MLKLKVLALALSLDLGLLSSLFVVESSAALVSSRGKELASFSVSSAGVSFSFPTASAVSSSFVASFGFSCALGSTFSFSAAGISGFFSGFAVSSFSAGLSGTSDFDGVVSSLFLTEGATVSLSFGGADFGCSALA